jgi:CheY-like chemotaxis protein
MVVLVAEDEMILRMVVVEELRSRGHEVLSAANGGEALRMIGERDDIQVLITDHAMPGITGAELIRQVKAEHPDIKAVLVSGHREAEDLAKEVGADRFYPKPIVFFSAVVDEIQAA